MRLYLVRHGEAEAAGEGGPRLTERGVAQVKRVAAVLGAAGIQARIQHSGKLRARQTAELIAARLAGSPAPGKRTGLSPEDDPEPVAREFSMAAGDWMLVGHNPFMGRLAALLLTGGDHREVIHFVTATVLCLERGAPGGAFVLRWALTPEIAPPAPPPEV